MSKSNYYRNHSITSPMYEKYNDNDENTVPILLSSFRDTLIRLIIYIYIYNIKIIIYYLLLLLFYLFSCYHYYFVIILYYYYYILLYYIYYYY